MGKRRTNVPLGVGESRIKKRWREERKWKDWICREESLGVWYCSIVALWEVTVLLLCRHHGCVSWESGPVFAITPMPGEISHIAGLACWGLKCQSRREVFKLSPLGGHAAAGWRTRQTLTGSYANRHIKAYIHALAHCQMATHAHTLTYTHTH